NHNGEKISEQLYQNFRYTGKNKIIVQKDGKWGIINDKGEVLLPCNYRGIQTSSERKYYVWKLTSWTVKNNNNEIIANLQFDSLRYIGEGLYRFSMIGKKGIVDAKGNIIVGTAYEEISNYRYGLSKVKKDNYGVINSQAKVIIPFEYDDVLIDELFIRVKTIAHTENGLQEKWGLYDHKGNILIKPKYAKLNSYSEGLIAAQREDGTWGYIDENGNTEIIFRYSFVENFEKGVAKVSIPYSVIKKDLYAIIDKKGEYVISPGDYDFYKVGLIKIDKGKASMVIPKEKYSAYESVNNKYIRVFLNDKSGIIDADGREIIPPVYDKVSNPSEQGIFIVEKDFKYGIIDNNGTIIFKLSNRYERIFGFKGGFSKILLRGKYGFIDKHGDIYISAQYPEAGDMSDSMVNVIIRDKWGFLDYRETLKVQPYYEEVSPFKRGIALVKENGKWNIINKEGKKLHKNDLDKIEKTRYGKFLLSYGGKYGLADENGKEILAIKYDVIEELGTGYVMVKKNNLWGVLDYQENFIIPIEFDILYFEPANNTYIGGIVGKQEEIHLK
ncbi:MAG: WG repeat-containing protein, partial [Cytophagaceae bacterium]|nr:WG repeat-containing protein [Cytophagaceae bacterium]